MLLGASSFNLCCVQVPQSEKYGWGKEKSSHQSCPYTLLETKPWGEWLWPSPLALVLDGYLVPGGYLVSDGYLTILTRPTVESETGKSRMWEGEENGKNENKGERGGRQWGGSGGSWGFENWKQAAVRQCRRKPELVFLGTLGFILYCK